MNGKRLSELTEGEVFEEIKAIISGFHQFDLNQLLIYISKSEWNFLMAAKKLKMEKEKKQLSSNVRISEIGKCRMISSAAVSRTAHSLEKRGYVRLIESKEDRRQTFLEITEEGENVILLCEREVRHFWKNVVNRIGMEQMDEMIRLLFLLEQAMGEEMKECLKKNKKGNAE